jgi:hypothetical protein
MTPNANFWSLDMGAWHARNLAENQQSCLRIARKSAARQDGARNTGVISRNGVLH